MELVDVLDVIKENYDYGVGLQKRRFEKLREENQGRGCLLAWAVRNQLSSDETLRCFGKYYTDLDPDGDDHQNIRAILNPEIGRRHFLEFHCSLKMSRPIEHMSTEDPRMSHIVVHGDVVYLSGSSEHFDASFDVQVQETLQDRRSSGMRVGREQLLTAQLWLRDMEDSLR